MINSLSLKATYILLKQFGRKLGIEIYHNIKPIKEQLLEEYYDEKYQFNNSNDIDISSTISNKQVRLDNAKMNFNRVAKKCGVEIDITAVDKKKNAYFIYYSSKEKSTTLDKNTTDKIVEEIKSQYPKYCSYNFINT